MVPKVECIYYLDGVWRAWMRCEMSWRTFSEAPSDMENQTDRSKPVLLSALWTDYTNKPSYQEGFHNVSLQITVLFVYVLGCVFWWPLCGFIFSQSLYCFINWSCKCCVLNYCKYSMFWKHTWNCMLASVFIFHKMDFICSTPLCQVSLNASWVQHNIQTQVLKVANPPN